MAEVASARLEAQEHLRQGNAAFLAGRVPDAIAEYQAAERLFPSPHVFYNLGQAYEALGQKSEALVAYEKYIAGLSAEAQASAGGTTSDERRRRLENARARADALRQELLEAQANAPPPVVSPVTPSVTKVPTQGPISPPKLQISAALAAQPGSNSRPPPAGSRHRTIWLVGIGLVALVGAISTVILIQRSREASCPGTYDLGCVSF